MERPLWQAAAPGITQNMVGAVNSPTDPGPQAYPDDSTPAASEPPFDLARQLLPVEAA